MKRSIATVFTILLLSAGSTAWSAPMGNMEQTMQKIHTTENPEERERLLEEHLEQMHQQMEQMHQQMEQMHQQMGQMMEQMGAQRTETKRLHDHRKQRCSLPFLKLHNPH